MPFLHLGKIKIKIKIKTQQGKQLATELAETVARNHDLTQEIEALRHEIGRVSAERDDARAETHKGLKTMVVLKKAFDMHCAELAEQHATALGAHKQQLQEALGKHSTECNEKDEALQLVAEQQRETSELREMVDLMRDQLENEPRH